MVRRLQTDAQFERAYRSQAAVYVRDRSRNANPYVGALEGFNPMYVTVSGERLPRRDYDFLVLR